MEKLSVQERLSLAAKAKSKSRKKNKKLTSPDVVESPVDPVEQVIENDSATLDASEKIRDATKGEQLETEEDAKGTSDIVEYFNDLLHADKSVIDLDTATLLQRLYPILSKEPTEPLPKHIHSSSDSSLIKLVKEKDETIESLLKEGEALSKKELQQSDVIRRLKKTVKELESDFRIKLDELQDSKTRTDVLESTNESLLASVKDLEIKFASVNKKYEALQNEYDEHMNTEYESKKTELKKALEENEGLRQELLRQYEEASLTQKTFDLKYKTLQETSKEEVERLELRLEQMRIDLENQFAKTSDSTNSVTLDSDAYNKLLSQYKATQHELSESNKNWSSIEYALNEKCDSLKTENSKANQNIDCLTAELKELKETHNDMFSKINHLSHKNAELQAELDKASGDLLVTREKLSSVSEDYEILQKQHNIQKTQLEKALGNPTYGNNSALEGNNGDLSQVVLDTSKSSRSSQEHPMTKWDLNHERLDPLDPLADEKLDELKEDFSFEKDLDIPYEAADLELLKRGSSELSLNMNSTSLRPNTARETQSSANNSNLQMVTRLGGEIRRLETELSSIREAYNKLTIEKEQSNEEISRLLETNEEVNVLKKDKETLSQELKALQSKQNTILELLGEKSERVEELENDVVDLKDMMRTQVQQMVALQEQLG
ncbi:unnamed protein product [Kluyveromyces dobzhanskii CBS 2104]|uniref:WGS project CCBQ000000000 data, contig 00016 n=1 Tax=Kluyveromyces dobzhanskii CBS 2104 TaxID=1427455 RepID=A0A0A8L249_9SACH|nr:unnamed protein product [Kluyveromyces dobzhanskii CBS 2104]